MGRKAPLPGKKRAVSGDQEVCEQTSQPTSQRRRLLISLKVRKMLERTSGLHKLMSVVHRMGMKLESKALASLQIKAETLQRNLSVRNVYDIPCTL